MQRIIKSGFPCASTYVHMCLYLSVCVCVCFVNCYLHEIYKCDTIKQAITIAITTKRFDIYTNTN